MLLIVWLISWPAIVMSMIDEESINPMTRAYEHREELELNAIKQESSEELIPPGT